MRTRSACGGWPAGLPSARRPVHQWCPHPVRQGHQQSLVTKTPASDLRPGSLYIVAASSPCAARASRDEDARRGTQTPSVPPCANRRLCLCVLVARLLLLLPQPPSPPSLSILIPDPQHLVPPQPPPCGSAVRALPHAHLPAHLWLPPRATSAFCRLRVCLGVCGGRQGGRFGVTRVFQGWPRWAGRQH